MSLKKNPFGRKFAKRTKNRYNRDDKTMTHGEWMCLNTSLNKKSFSFDRYPFQEAIADDMHDNLCCIKPSQVGLTEIQIRKALTILKRTENISLIYTMPNEAMFKRISKARIQPIIDYDKAFKSNDRQSMGLIRVGSSYLYVTGSSEGDATSINADIIFNDEIDLTPPDMLALFSSRLQGSDLRITQKFSTPTYEGVGVHRDYASSDQMEYMIKCRCCNHHQIPDFNRDFVVVPGLPDHIQDFTTVDEKLLDDGVIDLRSMYVKCEKCHKPLDLGDYANREWVPRYPTRLHSRGYKVRPMSTNRLGPDYIFPALFTYKRRDNIKGFKNTVLGEVHTSENSKLSEPQVKLCMRGENSPPVDPNGKYWIGIDVGLSCHIVIGAGTSLEEVRVVRIMTCKEDELEGVLARLNEEYKFSGGIDRYPYTPKSNSIRDKSNGAIMPIEYGVKKEITEQKDALGLVSHIQVSRTMMIDYVFSGVRRNLWTFEGYGNEGANLCLHLCDMVREEQLEGEAKWIKLNNTDHYFHALAFMVAGMVYNGVLEGNRGFESVQQGIFTTVGDFNLFAPTDLIGFHGGSTSTRDKIIKRY